MARSILVFLFLTCLFFPQAKADRLLDYRQKIFSVCVYGHIYAEIQLPDFEKPQLFHFYSEPRSGKGDQDSAEDTFLKYQGSGAMISPDGYIVTSGHIAGFKHIMKDALSENVLASPECNIKKLRVEYELRRLDGQVFSGYSDYIFEGKGFNYARHLKKNTNVLIRSDFNAFVIAEDNQRDLAIIKVPGKNHPYFPISPLDLYYKETVYGLSYNYDKEDLLFSIGQALKNDISVYENGKPAYYPLLLAALPSQPGSSGGVITDRLGKVVGIIFALPRKKTAHSTTFAIPARFADELLAKSKKTYGELERDNPAIRQRTAQK